MSRTQKLKELVAASLILKTLNDNPYVFLRDQRGKLHYWIEVALSARFPEELLWRAGGVKIRMLLHIRVRGRVRNGVLEFVRHS